MSTKIIHIDMDCFYAAVEIRDNPQLIGHPVAVGAAANKRGVLTTCNYEARKFGLHSAMPTARATKLCPKLILLPVNMEKYRQVSQDIHQIFRGYTEATEPLSLDEAYLDVSDSTECQGSATWLAQRIRSEIKTVTKLTASAGIAPNKFLAKVASDWNKPDGQFTISPDEVDTFIQTLLVRKIPGVGKVTAQKLHHQGIATCAELQELSNETLIELFGKFGNRLYDYCRGIDHRCVQSSRIRKSVSTEHTFLHNLTTLAQCEEKCHTLYDHLCRRLSKHDDRVIHKQFIKIKFADFKQTTKECVVVNLTRDTFITLLRDSVGSIDKAIRLLGVGVRFHDPEGNTFQQTLL